MVSTFAMTFSDTVNHIYHPTVIVTIGKTVPIMAKHIQYKRKEELLMVIVVIALGHIQEAIACNIGFSSIYYVGVHSYSHTLMRNHW